MKKSLLQLYFLLIVNLVSGQIDEHGKPVYNSQELSNEVFSDFELSSNYNTICKNIDKIESSVFVSETPTIQQYIQFAKELPSNFFIAHRGEKVLMVVILLQKYEHSKTAFYYKVIDFNNGETREFPCHVSGDITAHRAEELLELGVDNNSRINNLANIGSEIYFDGRNHKIQKFESLKKDVIQLVEKMLLEGG